MINQVILTGTVVNTYDNLKSIKLVIAQNYKNTKTYIPVLVCNNAGMVFIKRYIEKGSYISVQGRVSTYKNNQGHESVCIFANSINFEGYKKNNNVTEGPANGFEEMQEDDVPFITI